MGVVLLVRHGQASFGSHQYDKVSPLGLRQAEVVSHRLAGDHVAVRAVVSGSLDRQRVTAKAIATACGLTVQVDSRWDEYDHVAIAGDHSPALIFDPHQGDAGRDRAELALDESVRRWIAGDSFHRERHADFIDRCTAALGSLSTNPGTTVVVTSGGVIAVICATLLGLPADIWPSMARVTINCGITKIVVGRRGTSMVSFNDHAHLESNRTLVTYR